MNWQICDQLRWIPLNLFRKSVVTSMQYVRYFKKISQVQMWMNYVRYRMSNKKNLSGDCLPLTLRCFSTKSALRINIFFINICLILFLNYFFHSSKIQNIISKKIFLSSLHKTRFFLMFSFKLSFITHLWFGIEHKQCLLSLLILRIQRRKLNIMKYFC